MADFTPNCEAANPIKVAAPPNILSVFPKGVSMASKATVPTIKSLLMFSLLCTFAKISLKNDYKRNTRRNYRRILHV